LEAAIARDSYRLAELSDGLLVVSDAGNADAAVERLFTTESARQQAREPLRAQAATTV
jgi:hypothetical protein